MYSRRPQGLASRGELSDQSAVATMQAMQRIDPLDEKRTATGREPSILGLIEGRTSNDLAPSDTAEIGRLTPDPIFLEA